MSDYENIRADATAISKAADSGNAKAKQIINLHEMCRAFPEPGAYGLMLAAYDDWKAKPE